MIKKKKTQQTHSHWHLEMTAWTSNNSVKCFESARTRTFTESNGYSICEWGICRVCRQEPSGPLLWAHQFLWKKICCEVHITLSPWADFNNWIWSSVTVNYWNQTVSCTIMHGIAKLHGYKPWLYYLLVLWLCTNYLSPLGRKVTITKEGLCFLICKIQTLIATTGVCVV